jgi:hypothetical protein
LFEILRGFVSDAEGLVIAGIDVLAVVFVGWTWWRTRALAPTLGSLLFAAVIVFGVHNVDLLSQQVKEDVEKRGGSVQTDPRARAAGR